MIKFSSNLRYFRSSRALAGQRDYSGDLSHRQLDVVCGAHVRRSEASDLLDEDSHLVLLDGAGAVLVELLEAGVEVGL